jgi:hypothetical protein
LTGGAEAEKLQIMKFDTEFSGSGHRPGILLNVFRESDIQDPAAVGADQVVVMILAGGFIADDAIGKIDLTDQFLPGERFQLAVDGGFVNRKLTADLVGGNRGAS